MNQLVKLIHEQPNVENTIPHTLYQASSPKLNLAEEDKFIIYASGDKFSLSTNTDLSDLNPVSVSLFVLNTNFIVWFNRNNVGIEIAYPAIIFHGLNEDSIYLNIEDNQIIGTYITIRCNPELQNNQNPLFNIIDSKITNVYEAISYVSELHAVSSDDDYDEGEVTGIPALEISHTNSELESSVLNSLNNSGQADDLDDNMINDNDGIHNVAGMHVDVGFTSIAGVKTRRSEQEDYNGWTANLNSTNKRNKLH